MIPSKVVQFFAHRCNARDLLVAEREVVLTYALHRLHEQGVSPRLAFKGGTALRKLVFGSGGRFSEDLDFTLVDGDKDEAAIHLHDALDGKTHHGVSFTLSNFYETDDSFAVMVGYRHDWNEKGQFKFQVSTRESPTLPMPTLQQIDQPYFSSLEFGAPPAIQALQPIEMIAEKVRATFQRVKVRDAYDLHLYATLDATKGFDIELVRGLVVLKLWQVRDPFDPGVLFEKLHGGEYDWKELDPLLPPGKRVDVKELLQPIMARFGGLAALNELDKRVIADSSSGYNVVIADQLREQVRARHGR